jgi:hypothetical protein
MESSPISNGLEKQGFTVMVNVAAETIVFGHTLVQLYV